jgi:DNA modification methylase
MSNQHQRAIRITCTGAALIEIEHLTGMQGNPKTISRKNLEKLKNRILKHGFNVPFHIWQHGRKNYLLDGHQRTRALLELQAQGYQVPPLPYDIIQAENLADAKDKLLGISSQYGEFSMELLGEFTADMELDADLRLPSGEINLDAMRLADDEVGDDDAPDTAPKISRRGDLWTLAGHRLKCGDATSKEDFASLMADDRAQLVFTDPPYGIDYDSRGEENYLGGIQGDDKKGAELERKLLAPAFRLACRYSLEEAAFYVWHASMTRTSFEQALTAAGLREHQYIIWVKPWIVMGRGQYHYQHEPCFYAAKGETTPRWVGDRKQSSVWTVTLRHEGQAFLALAEGILLGDAEGSHIYIQRDPPKTKKRRSIRVEPNETVNISTLEGSDIWQVAPDSKSEYTHPNQKPVELALRAMANNTEAGEIVLDMFAGSGSTLIAAQRAGRLARCMELDPRFADVTITRWCLWMQRHALTPEVNRNGKPFAWQKFCPEE